MSSSRPTAARLNRAWALPLGAVVVLTLAACGGGAANAKAPAAPAASASAGARAGAGAGANQQDRGGVRGTIAAVTGQVMQLQDTSNQTAVAWTSSTAISQQVAGSLADVTPGVCILATTASGTATASPSGAATFVTITQPVNGACAAGFGGAAGAPGGGMPT
ncbi:MAG: hypothetical protein J0I87_06775, partial [Cellulomonas sp.]|nr:hypothetical protein [Cellulomonas sp.]